MLRSGLLLFLFSGLLHAQTCACTIPVFRYALDRWQADHFKLVVPSSTSNDPMLTDLLRPLRANGLANLDITTSRDPSQMEALLLDSKTGRHKLWSGQLNQPALEAILESPARKELLTRILQGQSVIWVMVDDGKAETQPHFQRITERLKFLENVAALPIQDPNDPDSQLGPGPELKLQFSTLHLRADDPAERLLISMLAGPEGEIQPGRDAFAAAVFGRGRVLGAWPVQRLDDASLEDACMYLVGRCSCRVKNENPGWDLLMNVDWEKALVAAGKPKQSLDSKPATGSVEESPAPEKVVTTVSAPAPEALAGSEAGSIRWPVLAGSAALLLAAVGILFFRSKVV